MAKRGRKPKVRIDDDLENGPVQENFLEMEEDLLYHEDTVEIERYVRPSRGLDSYADSEEDSFAFWYGQN